MTITRSEIIKMLSEKTGYYQKDIGPLLKAYDELVVELLDGVDEDEDVSIQILSGIKISGHIVPSRKRKDPRNQNDIEVGPTVKLSCKFSENIRENVQNQYNLRKEN